RVAAAGSAAPRRPWPRRPGPGRGTVRVGRGRRAIRERIRSRACLQVTHSIRFSRHSMSNQGPAPGLSIFFPAYNDSGTIASLVITALRTARKLTPDHEVIVVNDGSADATAEILDELARTYPEVRVVHHEQNRGYGGALRSGFASAT